MTKKQYKEGSEASLAAGRMTQSIDFLQVKRSFGAGGQQQETETLIANRLGSVKPVVHSPIMSGDSLIFPESIEVLVRAEPALTIARRLRLKAETYRILTMSTNARDSLTTIRASKIK